MRQSRPVISVDTKKKELIGNYANHGQQWRPAKNRQECERTRFPDARRCRAPIRTEIYDLGRNTGFVNVGTDHDTAHLQSRRFADGGDTRAKESVPGPSARSRPTPAAATAGGCGYGRLELQNFADETELAISVCHFPPGTSKWNKIEHRLFSFISSNWRGEPLRDYETIVNLIANTTTAKGLRVACRLDRRKYPTGRKVSDEEMKTIRIALRRSMVNGTMLSAPAPGEPNVAHVIY